MTDWMMYRFPSQGGGTARPKTGVAEPAPALPQSDFSTHDALGRVIPGDRGAGASLISPALPSMELARGSMSSISTQSTHNDAADSAAKIFAVQHGRRYLRDGPYPLPCDLPELQRQNLHTSLGVKVFGKPICAPQIQKQPPSKVLEVGCGSGYWSSICHDYLSGLGHKNVAFTGLDIVPLAPDFSKQDMNWTFVQHDLKRVPMPFDDAVFDFILLKDLSLTMPLGTPGQRMLDECCRVLKPGGILEIWETDHVLRSLLPNPPSIPGAKDEDTKLARETGTFLISPGTPFANAHNRYLQDSNTWIEGALDRRKLSPTPCTRIAPMLLQEPETLTDVDFKRIAIPLDEMRWEREPEKDSKRRELELPRPRTAKPNERSVLTEEQAALRYTALLVVIQLIESLEPLLKEFSGKNSEEWQRWWAWMMSDLLEHRTANSGECLEIGAWWARKLE